MINLKYNDPTQVKTTQGKDCNLKHESWCFGVSYLSKLLWNSSKEDTRNEIQRSQVKPFFKPASALLPKSLQMQHRKRRARTHVLSIVLFCTLCALIKLTLDASDHIFLSFTDLSLGVQKIVVCLQSQFHPERQLLEGLHVSDLRLDPSNLLDGCFPSRIS